MRVPLAWLREHVSFRLEPRQLADELTEVGLAVDAIEGQGDAAVLDLDITTNRVDCMNVRGVAREVSVICGVPLLPLELSFTPAGRPCEEVLQVELEAPELCPRFCARVLDVRMGPSPAWLRERLEAAGVRPISNVVDLTNYAMLELGQPTHAFDLRRIPGGKLSVRWARDGERLRTLDGVERPLLASIGVVAGGEGPLALAGIMGGASSEVSEDTRVVALEAAYWQPLAIRRAARGLGMHTEASHRFERAADPEAPSAATARIAHLLEKIGAGSARPGLVDVRPRPATERRALLRGVRQRTLLGAEVDDKRTAAILAGLGFEVGPVEAGSRQVGIPSWRGDVSREADLIEEVGRHHRIERIPSSLPPARRPGGLRRPQARARLLREALVGAGFCEVVSWSFVPAGDGTGAVRLANPLAEVGAVLRTSLVVPGLVAALLRNQSHGRRDVALFELGRVFSPGPQGVREPTHLGLLLSGAAKPRHWSDKGRAVDFYDASGILELVGRRLRVELSIGPGSLPAWLHPGRSAAVFLAGEPLGCLGALHPEHAARHGLREEVIAIELRMDGVLAQAAPELKVVPLPRFPGMSRDLSLFVARGTRAGDLVEAALGSGGSLLRSVRVTDRYEGAPVPEGQISLTLSLRYQADERTLLGEEVQASVEAVARALREGGAETRGE